MRHPASRLTSRVTWGNLAGRLPMRLLLVLAVLASFVLTPRAAPAADAAFAWPQFGYDEQHSGVNPLETAITAANVHSLKQLYRVPLVSAGTPSVAEGEPMFLGNANVNGARDVLFLTTRDG